MSEIQNNQDTSVNASVSSVLGVWQNLQIILGQQASRYIQAINEEIKAKRRKVSISDINGLLSFLENSINNTLSVSLKQQITITKLNTTQRMGKIPNGKNVDNNNKINENRKMKQTIRLNESELKYLIRESVKRVLREAENQENKQQMVTDVLKRLGVRNLDSINWSDDNYFTMYDGSNGSVFQSEEDARNSVLHGDDHQNAVDLVDGAMTDEEWVDYLIRCGVDAKTAETIIRNQDWDEVVKIIVDVDGPEWFLSTYSGEVHGLPDGSLLYY